MNFKRALGISLVAFLSTLVIEILTAIALGIPLDGSTPPSPNVWRGLAFISSFSSIIITALCTIWYLQDKKIERNSEQGILFGLTIIAAGFTMNILLFMPQIIVSGSPRILINYYSNPLFWLTLVLILGTTTFTAQLKHE